VAASPQIVPTLPVQEAKPTVKVSPPAAVVAPQRGPPASAEKPVAKAPTSGVVTPQRGPSPPTPGSSVANRKNFFEKLCREQSRERVTPTRSRAVVAQPGGADHSRSPVVVRPVAVAPAVSPPAVPELDLTRASQPEQEPDGGDVRPEEAQRNSACSSTSGMHNVRSLPSEPSFAFSLSSAMQSRPQSTELTMSPDSDQGFLGTLDCTVLEGGGAVATPPATPPGPGFFSPEQPLEDEERDTVPDLVRTTPSPAMAMKLRPLPAKRPEENYEISDKDSNSESEAEHTQYQKPTPDWVQRWPELVQEQAARGWDPDSIFGPVAPVELEKIFCNEALYKRVGRDKLPKQRRGSSGNWANDRLGREEIRRYKKRTGQLRPVPGVFAAP